MHSRHVRKFKDGTYWVALCGDGLVNSYNQKGNLLKSISVRDLSKQYGMQNTKKDYVPVFEVNHKKEIVWKFNDKKILPEPLGIFVLGK
jgi:hypothetical protein